MAPQCHRRSTRTRSALELPRANHRPRHVSAASAAQCARACRSCGVPSEQRRAGAGRFHRYPQGCVPVRLAARSAVAKGRGAGARDGGGCREPAPGAMSGADREPAAASGPATVEDLKRLAAALAAEGVAYVLIGGDALNALGCTRATTDTRTAWIAKCSRAHSKCCAARRPRDERTSRAPATGGLRLRCARSRCRPSSPRQQQVIQQLHPACRTQRHHQARDQRLLEHRREGSGAVALDLGDQLLERRDELVVLGAGAAQP